MFADRYQAGLLLAEKLVSFKDQKALILAIPRGGVVVGRVIADQLDFPLGVIYAKKISHPGEPELATGGHILKERKFGATPDVKDKTVILVDDGIATGMTIMAAISYLRKKKAKSVILAVPVAPSELIPKLQRLADELVVLETPADFRAVGQFYENFPQVSDTEVLQLLSR